jgi:hypothetical protein
VTKPWITASGNKLSRVRDRHYYCWVLHQPPFDSQTRGTRENRAPPCVKVPGSSRVPPHANIFVMGPAGIKTHTLRSVGNPTHTLRRTESVDSCSRPFGCPRYSETPDSKVQSLARSHGAPHSVRMYVSMGLLYVRGYVWVIGGQC